MKLNYNGKVYEQRLTIGTLIRLQEEGFDLESLATKQTNVQDVINQFISVTGVTRIIYTIFKKCSELSHITFEEFAEALEPKEVASLRTQLLEEFARFFEDTGRKEFSILMTELLTAILNPPAAEEMKDQ